MSCIHILLRGVRKDLDCGKKISPMSTTRTYCSLHYKKYENQEVKHNDLPDVLEVKEVKEVKYNGTEQPVDDWPRAESCRYLRRGGTRRGLPCEKRISTKCRYGLCCTAHRSHAGVISGDVPENKCANVTNGRVCNNSPLDGGGGLCGVHLRSARLRSDRALRLQAANERRQQMETEQKETELNERLRSLYLQYLMMRPVQLYGEEIHMEPRLPIKKPPEEVLAMMKRVKDAVISLVEKFENNEGCDCSICMEPLSKDTFLPTACGHTFHSNCIGTWLNADNHGNCPLCRTVLL